MDKSEWCEHLNFTFADPRLQYYVVNTDTCVVTVHRTGRIEVEPRQDG